MPKAHQKLGRSTRIVSTRKCLHRLSGQWPLHTSRDELLTGLPLLLEPRFELTPISSFPRLISLATGLVGANLPPRTDDSKNPPSEVGFFLPSFSRAPNAFHAGSYQPKYRLSQAESTRFRGRFGGRRAHASVHKLVCVRPSHLPNPARPQEGVHLNLSGQQGAGASTSIHALIKKRTHKSAMSWDTVKSTWYRVHR